MDFAELVDRSREQLSARMVFGEPVEREGIVMVPAARVRGGGGGGASGEPGETGGGFGMTATPAGAFIFGQGKVRWRPAVNPNQIILGGQIVAATALLVFGSILRQRAIVRRGLFGRGTVRYWLRHRARAKKLRHR